MITDLPTIALTYLKGMFIIDFISSIPYDLLSMFMNTTNDAVAHLRFFRLLRLIRLLKLARIVKGVRILKRWQDLYGVTVKYSVQQILKFMVFMFIVCHWIACLWRLSPSLTGRIDWYNEYKDDPSTTTAQLYFICFYWSLQTISTMRLWRCCQSNECDRACYSYFCYDCWFNRLGILDGCHC